MNSQVKRFFLSALTFLAIAVTVSTTGGLFERATAAPPVQAAKKAPVFSIPNIKGGTAALSNFKGKVVLVNFWATWCGPCVSELPELNALQKEFNPQGFEIVGISMDDDAETVKHFMKGTPMNYTVGMGNPSVQSKFGKTGVLPTTYLIDRKGNIRKEFVGRIKKQDVEAVVKALLAEK
ncbi:MAG: TlpA family protein disulfide reductase [Blastocatellia bacterium]|nr:TlpA family protein disulfide reductase [Blastocatellia bacterium]